MATSPHITVAPRRERTPREVREMALALERQARACGVRRPFASCLEGAWRSVHAARSTGPVVVQLMAVH